MKIECLDTGILAKNLLSKKEISYKDISRAFMRVEEVCTTMCCGRANFDRSFLVVIVDGKEEIIETDSPDIVRKTLDILKEKNPDIQIGKP